MSGLTDEQVQRLWHKVMKENIGPGLCIDACLTELLELRAMVARLPKLADGVLVVPGDIVYAVANWMGMDGEVVEFLWNPKTAYAWNEGSPIQSWRVRVEDAYSTKEAALAATQPSALADNGGGSGTPEADE